MSSALLTDSHGRGQTIKHASSSSGRLVSLDPSAGTVRFVPRGSSIIILRPSESFHHHGSVEEAPWTVLRGTVELDLPRARRVDHLEVEVVNLYEPSPSWASSRAGVLFSKKQIIDTSESKYYAAGIHQFMFDFPIDPSSAPMDNLRHGRIYQRVLARAPGIGAFGSDATASLHIAFIVIPSPVGELPPALEWRHEAFSDEIGPYSLDVFAAPLTVSALLNFRLRLHDPPYRISINGVFVSVVQTVHLQIADGAYKKADLPTELLAFAWDGGITQHETTPDGALGGFANPLKPPDPRKCHTRTLEPGKPQEFACLGQLPSDTWLRPSTFDGTKTPMKISHMLKVTVVYRHPTRPSGLRQLAITRPMHIASCCSISSNLILPEYGAGLDSNVLRARPDADEFTFDCACGMTLESMVSEAHRSGLARHWEENERVEQEAAVAAVRPKPSAPT